MDGRAHQFAALPQENGGCCYRLDLSRPGLRWRLPEDDGAVLPFVWCPKENLAEREEIDRVPYRTWAKQGLINPTPGHAIDKRAIAAALGDIQTRFDVRGIAFDRYAFTDLQVTFNDLRGTAGTRLADAECTPALIASITGHSQRSVAAILNKYQARTRVQADLAIEKLESISLGLKLLFQSAPAELVEAPSAKRFDKLSGSGHEVSVSAST